MTILRSFENASDSNTNKYINLLRKKQEQTIPQIKDTAPLRKVALFGQLE